jgi:hypothetical protein
VPTYDPIEAALDALVAYFDTAVASLTTVRKGWPEHPSSLDLAAGPAFTVTPIATIEEPCAPKVIGSSGSTRTVRVGYVTIRAQLDLWTAYRAQREDQGVLVEAALNNQLPRVTGLWLSSTNHYSRPLTVDVTAGRIEDDQGGVERGEWRRSWDVTIRTDRVQTTTIVDQSQIDLEVDTTVGDQAVTEPTTTID